MVCQVVRYCWVKVGYQIQHIVNQKDGVIISKEHPLKVVWTNGHVSKEWCHSCPQITSFVPSCIFHDLIWAYTVYLAVL